MNMKRVMEKIEKILQKNFVPEYGGKINVSKGWGENIHVLIVSDAFEGKTFPERDSIVWPLLEANLEQHEIVQISLCMLLAPDEVPATAR